MMGKAEEEGIIPQICRDLFSRIQSDERIDKDKECPEGLQYSVEVRRFLKFYLFKNQW